MNSFVEDTLGTKRGGAESAQRFLQDQLKQYRERLVEAETALAEFKKKNVGMIPGEEGGYFRSAAARAGRTCSEPKRRCA